MTCTAAGVAAAETIDVERLLWTPGEKTIFLPTLSGLGCIPPGTVVKVEHITYDRWVQIPDDSWIDDYSEQKAELFRSRHVKPAIESMMLRIDEEMMKALGTSVKGMFDPPKAITDYMFRMRSEPIGRFDSFLDGEISA